MAAVPDRLANYVPVNERLEQFYADHPNGRVLTTIMEHDAQAGFILIRSEIYRTQEDAGPAATGHAFEYKTEGYVNKTSYIENCETSAVGRGLALLGYEIKRGIASREEMQKVERHAGAIKAVPTEKETLMDGVKQACALLNQAGDDPQWSPSRLRDYVKDELGAASVDDLGVDEVRELIKRLSLRLDEVKSGEKGKQQLGPFCECGIARTRVEGITKQGKNKGKPWAAFMCANKVKEHEPVWIDLNAEAEQGEADWLEPDYSNEEEVRF